MIGQSQHTSKSRVKKHFLSSRTSLSSFLFPFFPVFFPVFFPFFFPFSLFLLLTLVLRLLGNFFLARGPMATGRRRATQCSWRQRRGLRGSSQRRRKRWWGEEQQGQGG